MTMILLILATTIMQASGNIPSADVLCGFIVDSLVEVKCIECFQSAGHISVNPEAVRHCVGSFLPPKLAECSVPQGSNQGHHMNHNNTGHSLPMIRRPGVHHPGVHGHHVTANLLPNCLKRRMKDMSRYLQREQSYTSQAGKIVKSILNSHFIPGGGVAMLDIGAIRNVLANKDIEELVKRNASICLATEGERAVMEDHPPDWDLSQKQLNLQEADNIVNWLEEGQRQFDPLEDEAAWHQNPVADTPFGTELPFGGRGPIAHDLVVAQCIIDKLIPCCGLRLVEILTSDRFYTPIPHAWFEPLLKFYKEFRASLNSPSP